MSRLRSLMLVAVVIVSVVAVTTPATGHKTVFAVDTTVEPTQPTAGDNTTVAITVSNLVDDGEDARVSEIELRNGTDSDADRFDRERPHEWVSAGSNRTWELYAELEETGQRELAVEILLLDRHGEPTRITRAVPVTVRDPHPSLAIATEPVGPAGRTDVTLTLANGAGTNVTGMDVALSSPDVSFSEPRRVVSSLGPGREAELAFSGRDVQSGPATFTAELAYSTSDGERRSVERTLETHVDAVDNPARVELTGTRIEQQGQTLVVRGSASNPGGTNATGAVVRAQSGDAVAPGSSQSSFFVGDVAASSFRSFEVHSRLTTDTNETVEIPIELEYGVDGERVTRETTLSYTPTDQPDQARRSGGGPPLAIVGLLVVGILAVVGWRRYR